MIKPKRKILHPRDAPSNQASVAGLHPPRLESNLCPLLDSNISLMP